ncbi:MAG: serine acetyltransferase [Herpetosiphonaceae bacterium]|nr:serine acetyltransferase [Herpetosiphonaceae bacterium]
MLRRDIARTYQLMEGNLVKRWVDCARSPGVQAVVVLRFGQWLYTQNTVVRLLLTMVYVVANFLIKTLWGIELGRRAQIGEGFYIGHFSGIFVAPESKIGKNCNISQGVTIGVSGQGERRGCPTIGDNVYLAPGAKVFGRITIGNNVKIGANAVIYRDIPDNATVVLDPGYKIISMSGQKSSE